MCVELYVKNAPQKVKIPVQRNNTVYYSLHKPACLGSYESHVKKKKKKKSCQMRNCEVCFSLEILMYSGSPTSLSILVTAVL